MPGTGLFDREVKLETSADEEEFRKERKENLKWHWPPVV